MVRPTVPGPTAPGAGAVAFSVDAPAGTAGDLTYGEWGQQAAAVARGLAAEGVAAGAPVGLLFDAASWADFAVAYRAVLGAGAVAVLVSPGTARPDLRRALDQARVTAVLGAAHLVPPGLPVWSADPDAVGRGHTGAPSEAAAPGAGEGADLVLLPGPLAPPRWENAPRSTPARSAALAAESWLVHAWAPGTVAGLCVVRALLGGAVPGAATLAAFEPDRLGALVERRRAATLGLTPGLAAALLASGAYRRHDLSSVRAVVLSAPPTPALRNALRAAFPGAAIREIGTAAAPATGAALAPVAVAQEGMLWHEQFTPGSFNLPCLVRRYRGSLDAGALWGALSELVRRHQPLRTTFALVDGEPRQVVGEHRQLPSDVLDLGGMGSHERDGEVARLLADATSRPFDLTAGPLFEPRLVRLGSDDHLLVVRLHHTVFDDWSVDLFRRELSALYAARLSGAPSPLVEPTISFADACRRQQARLAGAAGGEERAWWRTELAGAPLALQLPIGPGEPGRGEPLRVDLPPALTAGLRALAPRMRATPFMTVLAAFSVLLARTTGQNDLLLATVVAARNRSDVEPLLGCFTKKVPLRLRLDGDPAFPDLVARTRASLLGAMSHQGLAFDAALQEALGRPAADHGVVPHVAVVFQGETPQQVKLALPGLVTGPYEVPGGAPGERHFSSGPRDADAPDGEAADGIPPWGDGIYLGTFLILSLLETPESMALVARGVFSRPAVGRLLEDFQALLARVVADPSRLVSELAGPGPVPAADGDLIDVRGFRARRSRLEAALASCPGVAEVAVVVCHAGGEPRLVAYVVADSDPPPSLAQLRHALWARLPGAIWPAEAVIVDRLDRDDLPPPAGAPAGADPAAEVLAALWSEVAGRRIGPATSYWQDFSFLAALAEMREAGLAPADEQVVRCRTPEMLAAAAAVTATGHRPG